MAQNNAPNDWNEYRALVLHELENLNKAVDALEVERINVREEIAKLKVKSGIWGMIGGAIPVLIGIALWLLKGTGG